MTMMFHAPINYAKWNNDGSGKNIASLLTNKELHLWNTALKYQDRRDDTGHAECVTYFALKLLDYMALANIKAERSIAVAAAMLHDMGWSQLTKRDIDSFRVSLTDPKWEHELRIKHEKQGATLAEKILNTAYYTGGYNPGICKIIDGHDTRKGFLSVEDGLVRDADKLWRYTLMHLKIYGSVPGAPSSKEDLAAQIDRPGFFYSDAARQIARVELEHTFNVYEEMQRRGR